MAKSRIKLFENFDESESQDLSRIESLLKNNKDFKALSVSPDIISEIMIELVGLDDADVEPAFMKNINSKEFIERLKSYVNKPTDLGVNFGVDGPGSSDVEQINHIQQIKNSIKKYLSDK